MFEDSLFDSGAGKRPRKSWSKLLSFALEACAIGVLVMLPLIYTQALPKQFWTSMLEAPTPPPGEAQAVRRQPRLSRESREIDDGVLRQPSRIPRTTSMVRDEAASNEGPPSLGNFVPGGSGEARGHSGSTRCTR